MTQKIFWENPYLTELKTHLTSVNGAQVTVAQTIFYALAGGQESDAGMFNQVPVLEARKDGVEIFYTLPDGHGLQVNDPLTMQIDGARRYRLMRLHFAAEIILALVYQQVPDIQKIGAHIAADKARIDFEWESNIASLFPALKEQSAALIQADHAIISAFSDLENERRYWEIEGFARVACGGTHLKRTGEVGALALKRKNVGKGKERIEIYLAEGDI